MHLLEFFPTIVKLQYFKKNKKKLTNQHITAIKNKLNKFINLNEFNN